MAAEDKSWGHYEAMVLDNFERIEKRLDRLDEKMEGVKLQLVALQVRAGLWGALAGAVPALVAAIMFWLKGDHR